MRRTRKNFDQSDLDRALAGAKDLIKADLTEAGLTRAKLNGANLYGANLTGADLYRADLTEAGLTRAKLNGAKLNGANLTEAVLTEAGLIRANLTRANLTEAVLTGADLYRADLYRANLTGADLTGADLTRANLTGANLTGAILDDIEYDEYTRWPAGFTLSQPERHLKRAYGSMTGPVLKFGKSEVPYRARDFKQKYPQEFDLLKRMTGGADFSPKFAENLRQTSLTPYDWIVTHGRYRSEAQRLCPEPNFVLKLNIDMDDERFTAQQKDVLRKLAETSRRSGHPYERDPLFTVGWVRICRDDANGVWLVEEVQSDVQVVRQQKNDERLGNLRQRLDEIVEVMQPYVDRFYEDALGITLIEAEKLGFDVEMIDYDTKKRLGYNPPRSIYRDLPASMGISAKRRSKVLPDLQEDVRWTRPNPRRRR
jgi:uncharacterized protein YjbI with pentapeptide repeats